jgi:quercetin dioxygenase-like cupin family protein
MPPTSSPIPPATALSLSTLVTPTEGGVASRVLAKTDGGNVTLFAFDAGQGLEEHTSPFDALVLVQEGALTLTIGGSPVSALPGAVVLMPGGVPHALDASQPTRMLLVMLRDRAKA